MPMFRKVVCTISIICAGTFVCTRASAQDFHRNNIIVGLGPAIPTGNATNYLSTAPLVSLGYGYRFNRFLQADTGFQIAFGAAHNQTAVQTDLGPVQGGDHEFMFPLGGRFFVPLPAKRFEVSAGGGAMHLHYSETAPSSAYYSTTCYTCTSRGGWGGYGLANVSYFLDDNHNFRIGTTLQYISATTNGQAVGNVPATATSDRWMTLSFGFGLSF
jgi:hypothetical protein